MFRQICHGKFLPKNNTFFDSSNAKFQNFLLWCDPGKGTIIWQQKFSFMIKNKILSYKFNSIRFKLYILKTAHIVANKNTTHMPTSGRIWGIYLLSTVAQCETTMVDNAQRKEKQ